MYTGKIEPLNVTRQVLNALSDTLDGMVINFIIPEEQVSQEVNKIKVLKREKKSGSEELF